jgi:hypothetical protein
MDYNEIVTEWRTLAALVEADKHILATEMFADRSLALQTAIDTLQRTDPAGYKMVMAEVYAKVHPVERYAVVPSADTKAVAPAGANGDGGAESIHERDERIADELVAAARAYIENLPKEVVRYDEDGKIVGRHPLRFEGTEFNVATDRGQFSVSVYPAPYSRRESGRDG